MLSWAALALECFPEGELKMPLRPHFCHCDDELDNMFTQFIAQFEAWVLSTVTDTANVRLGRGRILEIGEACWIS